LPEHDCVAKSGLRRKTPPSAAEPQVVANVGCGPRGSAAIPAYFSGWQELRVDVDPLVQPDILGDLTDLSALPDGSVDALYAAHCLEHLYAHEVPRALAEFCRVLKTDGFACFIVPDLQTVAGYVASDKLHEPLYQSPVGPITPHDILFGHGASIAAGRTTMAHRCGFTPGMLSLVLRQSPFAESVIRRRGPTLELAVVARKTATSAEERDALVAALAL